MNSRALNMAWVIKWNRATLGSPILILPIITPNWLRVERAIIFFRSGSIVAASPAINIVKHEVIKRIRLKL